MHKLTVLYDDRCAFCRRCREFMQSKHALVELHFLACSSDEAQLRYGMLPWLEDQLVVVLDDGRVWAGSAAFVMCLWALADYREWSYRLAAPELAPLARRFFSAVSNNRKQLAAWVDDGGCGETACSTPPRGPYRDARRKRHAGRGA